MNACVVAHFRTATAFSKVLLGATPQAPKIISLCRELQAWVLAQTQSWMIAPGMKSATTPVVRTTRVRIASTMTNIARIAPKARRTCAKNVPSMVKSARTASTIVPPNVASHPVSVKKQHAALQRTMVDRTLITSTVMTTWQECSDLMHGHLTTPWAHIMDTLIRRSSTQA